jgi:hypothetical protein
MKKIITLFLLFALYSPSYAAGPYDGIYAISFNGFISNYASVHETDNQVIVILVDPNPNNTWGPASGIRTGNSVTLTEISGVSPSLLI